MNKATVDSDTLIDRWYVHRIRLDSEGTARRVRIGTEAFARPTEWFALDECEITDRGLSTPAVERIVQARSAPLPPGGLRARSRRSRRRTCRRTSRGAGCCTPAGPCPPT